MRLSMVFLVGLLSLGAVSASAADMNPTNEYVEELFSVLQDQGIDPESELAWGFSFFGDNLVAIQLTELELQDRGYELTRICQCKRDQKYSLNFSQTGQFTKLDLLSKLIELNEFAESRGLDDYVGLSVSSWSRREK